MSSYPGDEQWAMERAEAYAARVELAQPKRERLADALACVTEHAAAEWAPYVGRVLLTDRGPVTPWLYGNARAIWTVTDPAEAWEVLATRGVIPLAWVGDERRAFACAACQGRGSRTYVDPETGEHEWDPCHVCDRLCAACGGDGADDDATGGDCLNCAGTGYEGTGLLPHPPTVADAVALCSDVPGVLAAEALAREITGRERVVWRVGRIDADPTRRRAREMDAANRARPATRGLLGRRLDDLAATGYALGDVADDAVVLVCPAVG